MIIPLFLGAALVTAGTVSEQSQKHRRAEEYRAPITRTTRTQKVERYHTIENGYWITRTITTRLERRELE